MTPALVLSLRRAVGQKYLHMPKLSRQIVAIIVICFWCQGQANIPFEVAFSVAESCDKEGPAKAYNFNCIYMGQVGTLDKFCYMKCFDKEYYNNIINRPYYLRRSQRSERDNWMQEQKPLKRVKRDYDVVESIVNDPEWKNMWYLNRRSMGHSLPDHNVTAAWKMGYTGKGVVVTFLDDGLEYTHPDLRANYDPKASIDVNGNDADPTPRYDINLQNKHGTRCAGEVAAVANNSMCGVGAAFNAKIGGIRMLDGEVSDRVEAASLSHAPDHVDIYSASWGPDDNGKVVDGPGQLAKAAFERGIAHGRKGKGSIYVWASGNGGRDGDSCSCDGYVNSIYTFAISATTETGQKPWYQEECAGTLATTFSSGDDNRRDRSIITTDLQNRCTPDHTGTSAAAPLAAAFIALVLEARPDLTWRDVMYICILGSRYDAIHDDSVYVTNAAGFKVSNLYGFGLMDAGLMVHIALTWKRVTTMVSCSSQIVNEDRTIASLQNFMSNLHFNGCVKTQNEVAYIEQVQVFVNFKCERRGSLSLMIVSPSGTTSKILPTRARDNSRGNFENWPFLTLQFWGENPNGIWQLKVINTDVYSSQFLSWWIVVHGTRNVGVTKNKKKRSSSFAFQQTPTSFLVILITTLLAQVIAVR